MGLPFQTSMPWTTWALCPQKMVAPASTTAWANSLNPALGLDCMLGPQWMLKTTMSERRRALWMQSRILLKWLGWVETLV